MGCMCLFQFWFPRDICLGVGLLGLMVVHWKDWCWSWNSNTLATLCEELSLCKRPWRYERLGAGGEGDDRGWDSWMASATRWAWVWVNSKSLWWTGRPGMLQFMGLQRVRHDWETEMNWTELNVYDVGIYKYEHHLNYIAEEFLSINWVAINWERIKFCSSNGWWWLYFIYMFYMCGTWIQEGFCMSVAAS